jgi:type IV pilus biogenesis protein CpaD/CtpE
MFKSNSNPLAVLLLLAAMPLAGCAADNFFADESISPYGGSKQHPIKVANGKATVDDCGQWPKNVGDTETNELHANHGCAVQSNIAAMAAYPDDLIGNKRRLPRPLGDIQYTAIKKITGGSEDAAAAAPAAATPTP